MPLCRREEDSSDLYATLFFAERMYQSVHTQSLFCTSLTSFKFSISVKETKNKMKASRNGVGRTAVSLKTGFMLHQSSPNVLNAFAICLRNSKEKTCQTNHICASLFKFECFLFICKGNCFFLIFFLDSLECYQRMQLSR